MSKNLWISFPDAKSDESQAGNSLLDEYLSRGYIHRTVTEMARLSTGTITYFYRKLAEGRPLESPVKRFPDSSWMVNTDFCFMNIRATGLNDQFGNFIQASKILPAIRANAIHVGPFTDYDFDTIYAIRSVRSISPDLKDPYLPFSVTDQLRAFVEAAHLLGKAVGFDLEPHTAQFAIPVIAYPELFRWLKLSLDKFGLADDLTTDEMLAEEYQQKICNDIHHIVGVRLQQSSLDDLETEGDDSPEISARKQQVYFDLIRNLIEHGYWPIPSQSWAGRGVPAFGGYNFDGDYARFDYRGKEGEDRSASAFHILTPYKFYTGLLTNRASDQPALYKPAFDYFCGIFLHWRDNFDFDFVRYDSADHIFDSLIDINKPASDRPTPFILQTCIETSKTPDKQYIGNFAERMGNEIEDYASLDFDLILGDDMLQEVNAALLEKSFQLYDRLTVLNLARKQPASIAFCVDTHDTGNPAFWGEPLVKLAGPTQMGMRHFLSRFLSVGNGQRPKYEVMGSQDLSYGLYQANISTRNLVWVGDVDYNNRYHYLEDVFGAYKSLLSQGEITHRHVAPSYAWWLISSNCSWLVPIVAFMKTEPTAIDLPFVFDGRFTITGYEFNQAKQSVYDLASPRIDLQALPAGTCLLFVINPSSVELS